MRSKLMIPALVIGIGAAMSGLSAPASAQYGRVYGPSYYYGPGPVYGGPGPFRGAYGTYYEGPVIGPLFYGDGWVPESIYQPSRPGSIDPYIRPPGS